MKPKKSNLKRELLIEFRNKDVPQGQSPLRYLWGHILDAVVSTDASVPMWKAIDEFASGWDDFPNFEPDAHISLDQNDRFVFAYPGDPKMFELSRLVDMTSGEMLVMFPYEFVLWHDSKTKEYKFARCD